MTFGESIKVCLTSKYTSFEGRASRSEFWNFWLFTTLLNVAFGVICTTDCNILSELVYVLTIVPTIAVATRRLHDLNRSGWWQLLNLTIIGGFLLLYWYLTTGKAEDNKYGMYTNT